jgi:hypothetical protein
MNLVRMKSFSPTHSRTSKGAAAPKSAPHPPPRYADIVKRNTGNRLLDALSEGDFETIRPHLNPVNLRVGQVLSKEGEPVDKVYFPTAGLVSCRASGSEGETIEIYAIGHEGVVETWGNPDRNCGCDG